MGKCTRHEDGSQLLRGSIRSPEPSQVGLGDDFVTKTARDLISRPGGDQGDCVR